MCCHKHAHRTQAPKTNNMDIAEEVEADVVVAEVEVVTDVEAFVS